MLSIENKVFEHSPFKDKDTVSFSWETRKYKV